ncbi:MAG: hypothetical protein ABI197_10490 [Granulicella sp.]
MEHAVWELGSGSGFGNRDQPVAQHDFFPLERIGWAAGEQRGDLAEAGSAEQIENY